jgi:plasmid stability protein
VSNDRNLTTHFLEENLEKLLQIRQAGYNRFSSFEFEIKELLRIK